MKLGVVLWMLCRLGALLARPGEVLPDHFPIFSKQGTVYAAETGPDGSVFLVGDFTEVNGVPRPGIAKLASTGELDLIFDPAEQVVALQVNELTPRDPVFWPRNRPQWKEVEVLPLSGGGVIVRGRDSWELRDPSGQRNPSALKKFLRSGEGRSWPLGDFGGRLMMKEVLAEKQSEVVAYSGSDFLKDETFVAPAGIVQLGDAGGGKMWAIGQIAVEGSETPAGLVRLNENGTSDPSFDPVFEKHSTPLRSSSASTLFFQYVPRPIYYRRTEFFTVSFISYLNIETPGAGTWREVVETPFGYSQRLNAVDAGGVALYPSFDLQYLHRSFNGILDTFFQIPLAGPEIPVVGPHETQCVSYQPTGCILVGGTRRFLANGTRDVSWKQPRVSRRAVIKGLYKRPNGEIFVFGDFDRVDGEEVAGMVSLDTSGKVSPDFRPMIDLRSMKQVRERSDGKILVASGHERHSGIARNPRLILLDANGSFLGNLPLIPPDLFSDRSNLIAFDLLSDDGIVFTIRKPATSGERIYLRYLPPGETDGQSTLVWPIYSRYLEHPLVLADDRFIAGNDLASAEIPRLGILDGTDSSFFPVGQDEEGFLYGFNWRRPFGELQRSHPDEGFDASFQANLHRRGGIYQVAFNRGGKISAMLRADPFWIDTNSGLVRFHRNGRLDESFKVAVPGYEKAYLRDLLAVGDDLWVAGEFSEIGGAVRHGLALVDNGDTVGFSEWMEAVSHGRDGQALGVEDDPDGDGSSNFEEYAAGTDPFDHSDHTHPTIRGERSWEIRCNPDSPEVERWIEVSEDCQNWRFATKSETLVEKSRQALRWTLKKGARVRFSRMRLRVFE